jgi:transposase
MSLKALPVPPIPNETARVARAAFPGGTLCLQLRDTLGTLYTDVDFADLFPTRGQPAEVPWRLALVTVLQFVEGLPDRQAADAVRSRLDWKYALSLELSDPGFDHTVLSEFRSRLVQGGAAQRLLDMVLEQCKARGWLKARGRQRTDSTHVLAAVRDLNRLELAGEAVRACLEALAAAAPGWLAQVIDVPDWNLRYGVRVDSWRLPGSETKRNQLAIAYGTDGFTLLQAVYAPEPRVVG